MRKLILILLLVNTGFCADKLVNPIDPNSPEGLVLREIEVKEMLEELPVKQKELKTKVYTGTITDIISQRIDDCNAVIAHSVEIKDKAVKLADDEGLQVGKQEAVMRVIDKNRKVDEELEMKNNNEFLKAVITICNDPNVMPQDVNDPNYLGEVELLNEFMNTCFEMTNPV